MHAPMSDGNVGGGQGSSSTPLRVAWLQARCAAPHSRLLAAPSAAAATTASTAPISEAVARRANAVIFVRSAAANGIITSRHVDTDHNPADFIGKLTDAKKYTRSERFVLNLDNEVAM